VKPLRFHRAARTEIMAAGEHYASIHPELGRQFYDAMDGLVRDIRRQPEVFRMFDPPARRHFGTKFPYAVVFLNLPDRVWIVAVMHFKQRPGYWVERVI
jgi:toxin ParE1/3/4